ncbi:hydantoinase B/oxoprolinase family protein [Acetobacter okinawensis]|uniref:Hydantoin utilization protein B n=1 Tax=Acetobacter okinawensis TaxID=1076594 RepID=A0A252BSM5_9PROT|nr:hydantoinase B/oxoprolinase family protein [Acetobacter okinawensis]OUJ11512.1 hydantoin utilization protein B [Acetobacter okinawensis]
MSMDQTNLQILANYCAAAAESMGWTLMRTAHSTFIKETEDFSCQILDVEGRTVASPKTMGATWYTGLDYGEVLRGLDYEDGDIYLTSDPYSGSLATHTPDVHLWKPIFYDGQLMCFVGCHVHNTDVGGAVPASLSRSLTEIQQEGLRLPPMRLVRNGQMNEDLLNIIRRNVRLPEQNLGDLNAQLACVMTGERKIYEIIERFGPTHFLSGLEDLQSYAEKQARAIIRTLPDGDYSFSDYTDEDSVNGYPMRIHVTLRIRDDQIELDFTGSDPQLSSSLNVPTGGKEKHSLALIAVIYALYTLDPSITLNHGLTRPLRAILPRGSVVHAVEPAAVGMRSLTCNVIQTAIFGAFAQVLPDKFPASPSNGVSLLNVKTQSASGRMIMASLGPVGGGAGAGPNNDGSEGCGANMSFLKNTPVEINEAEVPIRMLRYGLVPDSGGAGFYRGGSAVEMSIQVFTPEAIVTARNRDRCVFTAWGLLGGRAGGASRFSKVSTAHQTQELGSTDVVKCDPGDILTIIGPGGGGYGNPFARPEDKVRTDVLRGFITPKAALDDYGVVLTDKLDIDQAATTQVRASKNQSELSLFGHGEGRTVFEQIWTPERYNILTQILARIDISWRHFIKNKLFDVIKTHPISAESGVVDVINAYNDLQKSFPNLPVFALI